MSNDKTEARTSHRPPACYAALNRLLIAASNATSIASIYHINSSHHRYALLQAIMKALDEHCDETRKFLKQHNEKLSHGLSTIKGTK